MNTLSCLSIGSFQITLSYKWFMYIVYTLYKQYAYDKQTPKHYVNIYIFWSVYTSGWSNTRIGLHNPLAVKEIGEHRSV